MWSFYFNPYPLLIIRYIDSLVPLLVTFVRQLCIALVNVGVNNLAGQMRGASWRGCARQRVGGIVLAGCAAGAARAPGGRARRADTARAGRTRAPRFASNPRSNDRRLRPVSYYRSINIPRARSPISKRSRGVFWTSDWQCRVKKTFPIVPAAPEVSIL